jgi:hypothetical protein
VPVTEAKPEKKKLHNVLAVGMGDGLFKMIEQKNPALAAEKY